MKNRKPIFLLISGSIIIGLVSFMLLLFFHFSIESLPLLAIFGFPIIIGLSTYLIFAYLINVFIKDRLGLIYRTIRKGKFTKEND